MVLNQGTAYGIQLYASGKAERKIFLLNSFNILIVKALEFRNINSFSGFSLHNYKVNDLFVSQILRNTYPNGC